MILVKAGCFSMGENKSNHYFSIFNNASVTGYGKTVDKFNHEKHQVCLSRDFLMSRFEVTQKVWLEVMNKNPSQFKKCGKNCPVEQVSWRDVQKFIKKINSQLATKFRLPTEAEWEYVASSDNSANNQSCQDNSTYPVGIKKPNRNGFYDMRGNVWEWVNDWYGDYAKNKVIDPVGPSRGAKKVIRGGSWLNTIKDCSPYIRKGSAPFSKEAYIGFRLAADLH
jgi:formylglycine-generating enzyme required for sulfatase activity